MLVAVEVGVQGSGRHGSPTVGVDDGVGVGVLVTVGASVAVLVGDAGVGVLVGGAGVGVLVDGAVPQNVSNAASAGNAGDACGRRPVGMNDVSRATSVVP